MLLTGQADTEVQIPNTTWNMVDAENNEMPLVKHALEHIPSFYVYFQVPSNEGINLLSRIGRGQLPNLHWIGIPENCADKLGVQGGPMGWNNSCPISRVKQPHLYPVGAHLVPATKSPKEVSSFLVIAYFKVVFGVLGGACKGKHHIHVSSLCVHPSKQHVPFICSSLLTWITPWYTARKRYVTGRTTRYIPLKR